MSEFCYWWERRGRGFFWKSRPSISALMRERLFDKVPAITLTSATLAVSGTFDFLKARLGSSRAGTGPGISLRFRRAGTALHARAFARPRGGFPRLASEIVRSSSRHGRAFVLFVYQQMRDVLSASACATPCCSGDSARTVLLDRFDQRVTPPVATSSFWRGGRSGFQLSAVIIGPALRRAHRPRRRGAHPNDQ
jgi:ATP-dependent DNA helicase DinG